MVRLLFVCHGNICRSPMAESVCAYEIAKRGLKNISVDSAAAHSDEIGNPPYVRTVEKLKSEGIPLVPHRAWQLTRWDKDRFDYFIGMDDNNVRDIGRILGFTDKTVCKLLDFTPTKRAIADPWYTRDFDATFRDIQEGVAALLDTLEERGLAVRDTAN